MQREDRRETREVSAANIIEVVRAARPDLRKSERKVADAVLSDPRSVLGATIAELSALASVSQPTVVRFSTAVGCDGFSDFKLRLAQALALGVPATHSVLLDSDPPEAVAEKIFDYTMTSLDWARTHLDRAALNESVRLLGRARSIEFFGLGASGIVARDAQQKFPLFGVPCGAQVDPHQQFIAASMMGPDDVAFVISNTGRTQAILRVAETARTAGAKVIGLVGADSPLVECCDVALVVRTHDNTNAFTPTTSRIAALVVIDILSTSVAMTRAPSHKERVADMKRHLRAFREADASGHAGEPID
ncbi:MurR/RpiR family transcriptional regulator [Aureimonas phyllosphaerae]|uniref:RpiR family carbohydrate utilization transcriptional regulator n=1 Tax=Aureimonas phyllosphaerae TaxID=1166078 RepID=A0A7W6BLG1_9HYPH|nr:MurR/RpiR family transcriptional regulator [Aureimonas phyllosphaerae]MBB3934159.1 RpiR family carbohydrate utilization transcriptional regulator [Aureimonas phyllosphaerae]MBB3958625.1 RpiR family carbohydrate utilization transcriptional regulator [Aureimonas phyllosphaerae]SFE99816.1 transcriptional regulator, RpiR family [Aureimonas phyllosphaerae]